MARLPSTTLIVTYVVAALFKIFGTIFIVIFSSWLVRDSVLNRWWMSIATGAVIVGMLIPWGWRTLSRAGQFRQGQLILALGFGILSGHIDLFYAIHIPYETMTSNPVFMENFGWSYQEMNQIHALGILFMMVPVVLASWHYGLRGFVGGLAAGGIVYFSFPLLVPDDVMNWQLYLARGFVLLGITFILAFTAGFLAHAQRQEQQKLAAANRKLTDYTATLEQLAVSRERNRLARELHDTLAHTLSGTSVQLQAVRTLLTVDTDAAADELADASRQIKGGLDEARRAIASLRSSPLEDLGLVETLRRSTTQLAERLGISVEYEANEFSGSLPPVIEQAVYRIAQEALANAEKYAEASNIRVALGGNGNTVTLLVADDGIGFDLELETGAEQYGLIGMRERAELIGGALTIKSAPGHGTRIRLEVERT